MAFYLIPLLIYFVYVFGFLNKKTSINIFCLSIFLLLALRENIGYDYTAYSMKYEDGHLPLEPISALLTQFSFLFNNSKFYFAIFAFFTIYFIWKVAIMHNNINFLLMYFLLPGYYIESFTLVRQALAVSLVIYGVSLLINKNKYYWIPIVLSVLTHFSAIFFVPFLFLLIILKNKNVRVVVAISFLILSSYFNLIREEMIYYFPRLIWYDGSQQYGFGQLFFFSTLFLIVLPKLYNSNNLFFYIILLGISFTFFAISIDGVFIRLSYYFFIPFLFYNWKIMFFNRKVKTLLWVLIFVPQFLYNLKIKTFDNFENSMLPYKTFVLKKIN